MVITAKEKTIIIIFLIPIFRYLSETEKTQFDTLPTRYNTNKKYWYLNNIKDGSLISDRNNVQYYKRDDIDDIDDIDVFKI